MPRQSRAVYPGVPHHVTHRATGEGKLFLSDSDYLSYLHLFHRRPEGLRMLAYCQMPNHVHWIVVPPAAADLAQTFSRAHGVYAQRFNESHGRRGHLWQGRFYSAPLDTGHLWNALAYVERNPVRAGLAADPQHWPWSSAKPHLTGADPDNLLDMHFWAESGGSTHWKALLAREEDEPFRAALRRATFRNIWLR